MENLIKEALTRHDEYIALNREAEAKENVLLQVQSKICFRLFLLLLS